MIFTSVFNLDDDRLGKKTNGSSNKRTDRHLWTNIEFNLIDTSSSLSIERKEIVNSPGSLSQRYKTIARPFSAVIIVSVCPHRFCSFHFQWRSHRRAKRGRRPVTLEHGGRGSLDYSLSERSREQAMSKKKKNQGHRLFVDIRLPFSFALVTFLSIDFQIEPRQIERTKT